MTGNLTAEQTMMLYDATQALCAKLYEGRIVGQCKTCGHVSRECPVELPEVTKAVANVIGIYVRKYGDECLMGL